MSPDIVEIAAKDGVIYQDKNQATAEDEPREENLRIHRKKFPLGLP